MDSPSTRVLGLLRIALDEFESVALAVSLRRAIRVGLLLGDAETAWRLTLDSKALGGSKTLLAAHASQLWPDEEYEAHRARHREALDDFISERQIRVDASAAHFISEHLDIEPESIMSGSVGELEGRITRWRAEVNEFSQGSPEWLTAQIALQTTTEVLERIRYRVFTTLCMWERQATFLAANATIFEGHRQRADAFLETHAPDVLVKFNAAYERANAADAESLSHALTSCRRILKTVADLLSPATSEVGEEQYLKRLREFTQRSAGSRSHRRVLDSSLADLSARLERLNSLTSKGVHDRVEKEVVDFCVIQTYLIVGELLRLNDASGSA